jgi:hypothetical protein
MNLHKLYLIKVVTTLIIFICVYCKGQKINLLNPIINKTIAKDSAGIFTHFIYKYAFDHSTKFSIKKYGEGDFIIFLNNQRILYFCADILYETGNNYNRYRSGDTTDIFRAFAISRALDQFEGFVEPSYDCKIDSTQESRNKYGIKHIVVFLSYIRGGSFTGTHHKIHFFDVSNRDRKCLLMAPGDPDEINSDDLDEIMSMIAPSIRRIE